MKILSHTIKVTVFVMSLAIFVIGPVAQAQADQRYNKHRDRHSYNNHHRYNYNRHNWRHNYNRHYYGHRKHRDRGGEVALGILTGGLLFYALTANNRSSRYDRNVYVQQQPVYVQPPQQQWVQQRPVQPQNNQQSASCLQVREYQTTITVGGQSVPAYGQSCLQPDGSWKLGPAVPEPGY